MIHSLSLLKYYQGFVAAQSKMSLWWTTQCFWSSFYKYIYEYFNENKTCFGWLMMFHSKHVLFSSKNIKKRFQKHRVIKAIYHFWNSSQACFRISFFLGFVFSQFATQPTAASTCKPYRNDNQCYYGNKKCHDVE